MPDKIFRISPYQKRMRRSLQPVSSFLKGEYDGRGETMREEGAGV